MKIAELVGVSIAQQGKRFYAVGVMKVNIGGALFSGCLQGPYRRKESAAEADMELIQEDMT